MRQWIAYALLAPWNAWQALNGKLGMLLALSLRRLLDEDRLPEHQRSTAWKWAVNSFVGDDQRVNVAWWGDPDETASSRLGRSLVRPPSAEPCRLCRRGAAFACRLLDLVDPGHCRRYAGPEGRYLNGILAWRRRRSALSA